MSLTPEHRAKISASKTGQRPTDATRHRMRVAQRKRRLRERATDPTYRARLLGDLARIEAELGELQRGDWRPEPSVAAGLELTA